MSSGVLRNQVAQLYIRVMPGTERTGASSADPFFTVIVPVHDDPDHVFDSIESILSQTFEDFELVLIDDGSEPAVVPPDDPRITFVRHDSPVGPAGARNAGLAVARGR